jgi:NmrA-like family
MVLHRPIGTTAFIRHWAVCCHAFYFFRIPSKTKFEGENKQMLAITGITGQGGGEVARNLLSAHKTVRGVVRDVGRGKVWAELGCHLVNADIYDAAALTAAFKGMDEQIGPYRTANPILLAGN